MAAASLNRLSRAFAEPLGFRTVLVLTAAILAVNTLYCLLYTALSGHSESVGQALCWSVANILPWLWAFEAGKRWDRPALVVGLALAGSLALDFLLLGGEVTGLEIARRLPGAALTLALLVLLRRRDERAGEGHIELPLPPTAIAWVAAAGNYVELHGDDRPLLVRAPLSSVEATLAPHGFVRIHRSTLVNRSRVARVRTVDLVLDDGRSLKLGSRYRATLQA